MRSRAHFALTDAGKRLFTLAQGIKASLLDYQAFLEATASFDGTLSVGILGALRNAPFERALASVAREYPQLKINLQVYPADDIQRQSECSCRNVTRSCVSRPMPTICTPRC